MANKSGTSFAVANGDTNVASELINGNGDAIFARVTLSANVPSGKAGYAIGCILCNAATGSMFLNRGTTTSCTFKDVQTYP